MNHISKEKLSSFCFGNPWQPRLGLAQRERQGNRICQTWSEPSSPLLCSRMYTHSKDDEKPSVELTVSQPILKKGSNGPRLEGTCGAHQRALATGDIKERGASGASWVRQMGPHRGKFRHTSEILQVQFQTTAIYEYCNKVSHIFGFWFPSACQSYIHTVP